jgi:RHS repeat-associated protein
LQNITYDYDAVGNISTISDTLASEIQTYTYDTLDRLLTASAAGGPAQYAGTYSYDPASGNLLTKGPTAAPTTLYYNDAAHKHAVTAMGSGSYAYDADGNQTTRVIAGVTYTLGYDAEGHLVTVSSPATNANFTYDGDGKMVKAVINNTITTLYVSAMYQVKTDPSINAGQPVATKYYPGGAFRVGTMLYYQFSDHLGSTSVTVEAVSGIKTELRYTAWGSLRGPAVSIPTDRTYTGQRSYASDFGLMYYNARWYDSSLGRFAQADTVVPVGVQGLDRYSYTGNNPVNFADPSGHKQVCTGQNNDHCYDDGPSTLDDFKEMSWAERKAWLQGFAQGNNLDTWFDDMIAAIDYLSSDGTFGKHGGLADVMDAGILQAVHDGWLLAHGGQAVGTGGDGWATFFKEWAHKQAGEKISDQTINAHRLLAEQKGVDYAWKLSEVQEKVNYGGNHWENIYFGTFKFVADSYRTLGINGGWGLICALCAGNFDPRKTGPVLSAGSGFVQPLAGSLYYAYEAAIIQSSDDLMFP